MQIMCEKCGESMRVAKNGVKVRYGYYRGYFHADLYECPICGAKVISGFSSEIYEPDAEVDYDFTK